MSRELSKILIEEGLVKKGSLNELPEPPRGYSWEEEDYGFILLDRRGNEVGSVSDNNGRWLHYTPDDDWPAGRGEGSAHDAAWSLLYTLGLD